MKLELLTNLAIVWGPHFVGGWVFCRCSNRWEPQIPQTTRPSLSAIGGDHWDVPGVPASTAVSRLVGGLWMGLEMVCCWR